MWWCNSNLNYFFHYGCWLKCPKRQSLFWSPWAQDAVPCLALLFMLQSVLSPVSSVRRLVFKGRTEGRVREYHLSTVSSPPNFALQHIIFSTMNLLYTLKVPIYPDCHPNCPMYRNSVAAFASPSRPVTECLGSWLSSIKVPAMQ